MTNTSLYRPTYHNNILSTSTILNYQTDSLILIEENAEDVSDKHVTDFLIIFLTTYHNKVLPRCIKPNNQKQAMTFVREVVQKQLNYTGVLETTKIRQCGYSTRLSYSAFINR